VRLSCYPSRGQSGFREAPGRVDSLRGRTGSSEGLPTPLGAPRFRSAGGWLRMSGASVRRAAGRERIGRGRD
jgi:hypothetical protein